MIMDLYADRLKNDLQERSYFGRDQAAPPQVNMVNNIAQWLNFVNDAAAAAGGIPVGGFYRNGSVVMIRVT